MLKIYFDWNCITHSKNIYPYILNIAEECGDRFIFPFSNAHIRDLMVSHNKENKYFDSDLDLLERICTKHYLLFEDGQMIPKKALIHLIKIDNQINIPTDFQQKCRLSVGSLFPE